jgi:hypothetical protein
MQDIRGNKMHLKIMPETQWKGSAIMNSAVTMNSADGKNEL